LTAIAPPNHPAYLPTKPTACENSEDQTRYPKYSTPCLNSEGNRILPRIDARRVAGSTRLCRRRSLHLLLISVRVFDSRARRGAFPSPHTFTHRAASTWPG